MDLGRWERGDDKGRWHEQEHPWALGWRYREVTVAWETDSVHYTELHELQRPQRTLKPHRYTSTSDTVLCVFYKNAFL